MTPLEIYESKEKKECCLTCEKLIVKNNEKGHVNFCGNNGKIVLDMFLECGNLEGCDYKRKAVTCVDGD